MIINMIFAAPPIDKVERSDQPEIWRKISGLSSGGDEEDDDDENIDALTMMMKKL